jgi:hypothetical protein
MAFLVEPPIDLEVNGGGIERYMVIVNENGEVLDTLFHSGLDTWLPDSQGYFRSSYGFLSLNYLDGQPGVDFGHLGSMHWPAMSPDGSTIFYLDSVAGPASLWQVNADGSHPTVIFDHGTSLSFPVWSPNGQWIAFREERYLWLLNVSSGDMFSFEVWGHPHWSADSNYLALSNGDILHNTGLILLIEPATKAIRELPLSFPDGALPDVANNVMDFVWSPDNAQLALNAYSYDIQSGSLIANDIWLVNIDTGSLYALTQDEVRKDQLLWMP